ncbi:MAG: hypothetical protein ACR2I2_10500 [Bryobacteraceae bacterium]
MSRQAIFAAVFNAVFISLLFLGSCTKTEAEFPALPETIAGGWHLASLQEAPLHSAPDPVRRTGLRKWWKARYDGPATVHLQIYELRTGPAALDLVQKWRPAANTVTFYTDRYFTVVDWDRTDRDALRSLIGRIEKALRR